MKKIKPLYPGVYVQEIASHFQSIDGVGTSTAAFIGETEKGPDDHAVMVTNVEAFQAKYGAFLASNRLAHSALLFFKNGGTHLYIARVSAAANTTPQENDYRNAFSLLDPIPTVNLVAVPGIGSPSMLSFGADYCRQRGDCFFIGDMDLTDNSKEAAQTFINQVTVKSSHAAVYFPWLMIADPGGSSSGSIAVPPSGAVAGIFARIDAARGVWKAAAGMNANIRGAVGLSVNISDHEQGELNPLGVNIIRDFQARGMVVWGARTLAARSAPEYRYVPVRRTAIFLSQSIYNGIQWAVFEPNDKNLWACLRLTIEAFMQTQFRAGAFQGSSARDAFFVKCDSETTTQADIDAGIVNILVGFAPLKPAEFILLKFGQKAGPAVV